MSALREKLDELIAATKAAAIPLDARWLDVEGCAAMLSFSPRHFIDKISSLSEFPMPLRIDGTGHPRWLASEVLAWAKRYRDAPRNGRPRKLTAVA